MVGKKGGRKRGAIGTPDRQFQRDRLADCWLGVEVIALLSVILFSSH